MTLSLPPKIKKLINDRVRSGKYRTPEDVVAAAMSSLDQHDRIDEFAPGELDALLAEGERDIRHGDVMEADKAFAELRRLCAASKRRRPRKAG
jgi:Arc/MetJ-type ribon-helix-helix transcriptional regulator